MNEIPLVLLTTTNFGSIEADIWAIDGELFVAHNKTDIKAGRTLESLYIEPVADLFRKNGGRAWKDHPGTFQLLIDLKTPAEITMSVLVEKLKPYRDVFDLEINPKCRQYSTIRQQTGTGMISVNIRPGYSMTDFPTGNILRNSLKEFPFTVKT